MKKILIIEDDLVLRENTADFLHEENFEVITAPDGKKGLDLAYAEFPDLIICDISMPEMNGYEVFQHLQSNASTAQIPFIFLTAESETKNIRKYMSMGADDYITKPFDYNDLLASVNSRIERRQKITDAIDEKFRAYTESSHTGVFVISEGTIEYANEQFSALTGYDNNELKKMSFYELLSEQYRNAAEIEIKSLMKSENNLLTREYRFVSKNSDIRQVLLNGRTTLSKNRIIFIGNVLDISDKESAINQIQQAKKEKELSLQAKKEFLNNISHELRTPMNGILGMTELLLEEVEIPEHRQYLNNIHSSANNLLSALNELIEISIIESGEYEIKSQVFNIDDTITNALKPICYFAKEKNLGFDVITDESCKRLAIGDGMKIKQIIFSLAQNAVKFTDSGRVIIKSKCEEETSGNIIFYFVVEDSGSGISPEKQEIIFEAFQQADGSATRKNGGLGLGLTISKKIVIAMGGKLWMQTEPGTGSIFCFMLKLKIAE